MLTNTRLRIGTPPRKLISTLLISILFTAAFFIYSDHISHPARDSTLKSDTLPINSPFTSIAQNFTTTPLTGPNLKDHFGELGRRVEVLTSWFQQSLPSLTSKHTALNLLAENLTLSHFPFLRNPRWPDNPTPLMSLKSSYITGSRGIVIPVGIQSVRFAIHLVGNIRTVLGSRLPIQVVFAGEDDLPVYSRERLREVEPDIEFIDVLTVFDDAHMGLREDGGWAIKPFAALASTFEQVILLDADCVFFQKPETLFEDSGYMETGALFFHDRKLWQHGFQDRHKWWKAQMKGRTPSATLQKSLVWTQDFAEEADSGVVVLNKSLFPLFMSLLHVCWQNTKVVREAVTYKMTYGDKESWWFGLELCSVPYSFEEYYGVVLGDKNKGGLNDGVCGFSIGHMDQKKQLIWYNGSLLKNKAVDKKEYAIPTITMYDGDWKKGRTKKDMSCMTKGKVKELNHREVYAVLDSVVLAKKADEKYLWR